MQPSKSPSQYGISHLKHSSTKSSLVKQGGNKPVCKAPPSGDKSSSDDDDIQFVAEHQRDLVPPSGSRTAADISNFTVRF